MAVLGGGGAGVAVHEGLTDIGADGDDFFGGGGVVLLFGVVGLAGVHECGGSFRAAPHGGVWR